MRLITATWAGMWQGIVGGISLFFMLLSLGTPSAATEHTPIRDHLYAVSTPTAQDGWIAGAFGTILHTQDGGVTWQRQVTPLSEHLFGIAFADTTHGWAVGRLGTILATVDGGRHWTQQPAPRPRHLFSVIALSPQQAWAIGDWGTILTTQDGGATWQDRSYTHDVILNDQSWVDTQHGWIVGEGGLLLATTDGGQTWTEQQSGTFKTLFGVHFSTRQDGWVVGIDGMILHTADGGASWQTQHGAPQFQAFERTGVTEALSNPTLYDITLSGQRGYAIGDVGKVFLSTDGGQSWQERAPLPGANLRWARALALAEGAQGFFVGSDGLIVQATPQQLQVYDSE